MAEPLSYVISWGVRESFAVYIYIYTKTYYTFVLRYPSNFHTAIVLTRPSPQIPNEYSCAKHRPELLRLASEFEIGSR